MAENSCVIVDFGSKDLKAGYAYAFPSEEEPRLVTPCSVLQPGEPATVRRAVRQGRIEDWDALEALLHYALYEQLGCVAGAEGGFVAVEPALSPRDDRERLAQMMFETFNVACYFATDSAVASLYGIGKHSGLVVDFGHEKTDVIPVLEGLAHASAAVQLPVGGLHHTRYLRSLLQARGIACSEEDAERLKIAAVKVSPFRSDQQHASGSQDMADTEATVVTLPDGQVVSVTAEEGRLAGEAAVKPSLLGIDVPSLADTLHAAGLVTTLHGEREARKTLVDNVFLCGGGSAVPGLGDRLLAEARAVAHPALLPALASVPEYMPSHTACRAAWMGGAVLAKVALGDAKPTAPQQMVTKADYEEFGPVAVLRKCS